MHILEMLFFRLEDVVQGLGCLPNCRTPTEHLADVLLCYREHSFATLSLCLLTVEKLLLSLLKRVF